MSDYTLQDLSKHMAKIDICYLSTRTSDGQIATRPMSNNGEANEAGVTYYFTTTETRTVSDIRDHAKVALSFEGEEAYIAVQGDAKIHDDRDRLKDHWDESLGQWFEDGLDTDGLVMIAVHPTRVNYWIGRKEGEVTP